MWRHHIIKDSAYDSTKHVIVYRAVPDEFVADVIARQGFTFLNQSRIYAASIGGIYFSTRVEDVLDRAKSINGGQHYFECVVDAPSRTVVLDDDNIRICMCQRVQCDTLFHNVRYSNAVYTEYVKAGEEGEVFSPVRLTLMYRHDDVQS